MIKMMKQVNRTLQHTDRLKIPALNWTKLTLPNIYAFKSWHWSLCKSFNVTHVTSKVHCFKARMMYYTWCRALYQKWFYVQCEGYSVPMVSWYMLKCFFFLLACISTQTAQYSHWADMWHGFIQSSTQGSACLLNSRALSRSFKLKMLVF